MQFEEKQEELFVQSIGKRIKAIRIAKGFRQNEIAYRCHFDKSSYNNIESGKRNITLVSLFKIAKALDIEIKELFDFNNNSE